MTDKNKQYEEFRKLIELKEKQGFKYIGNTPEIQEFMEKNYERLSTINEYKSIKK